MHVMLDLETLGKKAGCVVLSIGAQTFIPRGSSGAPAQQFYAKPDIFSQLMKGLIIDDDTVDWWKKKSIEAQSEFHYMTSALDVAGSFITWFEKLTVPPCQDEIYIWAKSPNFDCEILQKFLESFGFSIPWNFRRVMDVRTVIEVSGINEKEIPKPVGNVKHNALFDSQWQIDQVRAAYLAIKGPPLMPTSPYVYPGDLPPIMTKHENIDTRPLSEREIKRSLSPIDDFIENVRKGLTKGNE